MVASRKTEVGDLLALRARLGECGARFRWEGVPPCHWERLQKPLGGCPVRWVPFIQRPARGIRFRANRNRTESAETVGQEFEDSAASTRKPDVRVLPPADPAGTETGRRFEAPDKA